MRRRRREAATEPPPKPPQRAQMPFCGLTGPVPPGDRPKACSGCPAVAAWRDQVDRYRANLDEWATRTGTTPLDVLPLRRLVRRPTCRADI